MFKQLIEDLISTGLTEQDIGQRVGASQASINRIKRTNQKPMYELGAALVSLHKQITHPRVPPTPTGTEQEPGMSFGEFGEPRSGLDQRDEDRRTEQGSDFGNFGEPRDGDRRQDDRRGDEEAAA